MEDQGHGDILAKIGDVEGTVKEVKELAEDNKEILDSIYDCVAGTIGNGGEKPGLVGRVRSIEKWIETRVWFERLVIGIVAAQIIALLFIAARVAPYMTP
jgi:hypothetical protein